jgi:hypothetical protein
LILLDFSYFSLYFLRILFSYFFHIFYYFFSIFLHQLGKESRQLGPRIQRQRSRIMGAGPSPTGKDSRQLGQLFTAH